MYLLSGLLGSMYPTPSPAKLVGISFQDHVDILHILWFLFGQDAHCFGEERGEGKERNVQNSFQSNLWGHLLVLLSVHKLACVVLSQLGHWFLPKNLLK